MGNYRTESEIEEEAALFRSYPYALYFVQSPSSTTISISNDANTNAIHNNSTEEFTFHSPIQSEIYKNTTLSCYSSSRGSNNNNNSFKKKISHNVQLENSENNGVVVVGDGDEISDIDFEEYNNNNREWGKWKYFSFSYSNSVWWILVQLIWRLLFSLAIALIVFYIAAKPPPPVVSIKIAGIRQFRLGEGVDASGVATKILSCNCSIHLIIDNKSKLYDLHIHPPTITMFFGHLPFAISQGAELYAENDDITLFKLSVGTRNKPMYGAGRSMQDLLESKKGLPLIIKVNLKSKFQVILGLFESKYHHKFQCLLLLSDTYDKKHRTQLFNSRC
ncbi:hypothetical protein ACJIZ3_007684 [Penstemon smallii]|uniref:Late embryogenesis abundant protein LEA-2 subgroup domain-containing protein n=1 Tax=Penstemon smallii TaxID=265156 RepID=A0ABD3T953_9LAMI